MSVPWRRYHDSSIPLPSSLAPPGWILLATLHKIRPSFSHLPKVSSPPIKKTWIFQDSKTWIDVDYRQEQKVTNTNSKLHLRKQSEKIQRPLFVMYLLQILDMNLLRCLNSCHEENIVADTFSMKSWIVNSKWFWSESLVLDPLKILEADLKEQRSCHLTMAQWTAQPFMNRCWLNTTYVVLILTHFTGFNSICYEHPDLDRKSSNPSTQHNSRLI